MPFDLDTLSNLLVVYGINFLGAVVVALIGWWALASPNESRGEV